MALYVKTLYVLPSREDADAFNDARNFASELYAEEYAIAYGTIPNSLRYEEIRIEYEGTRNSKYEIELAQYQRKDSFI